MELFELDINALSKGKKEAFFILYKKFFVALCLFAQKFSIGKEAAEDIVLLTELFVWKRNIL